jgi:hypothetical protein
VPCARPVFGVYEDLCVELVNCRVFRNDIPDHPAIFSFYFHGWPHGQPVYFRVI